MAVASMTLPLHQISLPSSSGADPGLFLGAQLACGRATCVTEPIVASNRHESVCASTIAHVANLA